MSILLDASGLFTHVHFADIKHFIQSLLSTFQDHSNIWVSLATYSHYVQQHWQMRKVDDYMMDEVNNICYMEGQVNSSHVIRSVMYIEVTSSGQLCI